MFHPRTALGKAAGRQGRAIGLRPAEHIRFNANLKDNFAGRMIRLRGPDKVGHLMFSIKSWPDSMTRQPKNPTTSDKSPGPAPAGFGARPQLNG